MKALDDCMLCPRNCRVNRNEGRTGYCGNDAGYHIASVCVHHGEEPAISGPEGICNVFFAGCNMECLFCQNYQISRPDVIRKPESSLEQVTESIINILDRGIQAVGFVSPTPFTLHVKAIIQNLHSKGYRPVTVYNSNCYDNIEVLKSLEGLIDVYLPDLKYSDAEIADCFSDTPGYPEAARKALLEMYRQKGSTLVIDDNGMAVTGLIIRHLVLPQQSADSINILEWIADNLSSSVNISLMSQYFPTPCVINHPVLGGKVDISKYHEVVDAMERLGFHKGWIQDPESAVTYQPDFLNINPFGD